MIASPCAPVVTRCLHGESGVRPSVTRAGASPSGHGHQPGGEQRAEHPGGPAGRPCHHRVLSNIVSDEREIKQDHPGVAKLTGANISPSGDMKIQEIKQ